MITRSAIVALAATLLSTAAAAQTDAYFVNIGVAGFTPPLGTGYAAAAPFGGAWNRLDANPSGFDPSYTLGPLVDAAGTVGGVTLDWVVVTGNGMAGFVADEPHTSGSDEALLDSAGYAIGASDLRFTGLPAGTYDVYTYAMAPDGDIYFSNVTVLGSSSGAQLVGGDFSEGFVLGVTHARHTVTIAPGEVLVSRVALVSGSETVAGIQVVPVGVGIGATYCTGNPNSTGVGSAIYGTGSASIGANHLTLVAAHLPVDAFGFFITSRMQGFAANPAGSQGNLCLGGAIGRYVGPGQAQNSGAAGEFSLPLDLSQMAQPMSSVSGVAGDTWHFQAWHRDTFMGQPTSNFTNGLEVVLTQ